ncbi:MAG: dTDP-glucose 4,6-dehydratase [Candidatus Omnitrophota bacterium]
MTNKSILITGGAGFIGSAFVRLLNQGDGSAFGRTVPEFHRTGTVPKIIVVDSLTYAGDLKRLKEAKGRFKFYKVDICDKKRMEAVFAKEKPQAVVHFAAESHVDRSINDATPFIETNIKGTQILLDAGRKHEINKFIFISTDEVYGEIANGKFNENSPIRPNSPYAASKAAADLLVQAYIRTYKFPAIIIRPSNNYGPWQYPEKLIPLAVLKILRDKKVPVYAQGKNVREWLYVEDCAKGIMRILQTGKLGQVYNLGSNEEKQNIDVVKMILNIFNKPENMIEFVKDRPGHDIRYSLDSRKARRETNWKPKIKFKEGIKLTVSWYLKNKSWLLSKYPSAGTGPEK